MRIHVDRDGCIGAGQCAMVAGAVFDQDDEGIVEVVDPRPAEGWHAAVRRAASLCPARVIRLETTSEPT